MKKLNVLVIDNEFNIQRLMNANLTASGYHVSIAADGETGLTMARTLKPDLILLDLFMPGMSGWDVLSVLKADTQLQNIPVILITASIQNNQEAKALLEGAIAFMNKPFTVEDLLNQVKNAIGAKS